MGSLGGGQHDGPVIGPDDPAATAVVQAKRALRAHIVAARASRAHDPAAAARITAHLMTLVNERQPAAIAAHIGMPGEAPTLDFVVQCPVPVWLPVVRDDLTMGWAQFTGERALVTHRWGMQQPTGPLGNDLPDDIEMVIMPALAVDHSGHRLGRGAGYYDRALAAPRSTTLLRVVALPSEDLLPDVPHENHDERVDVVVTPDGIVWCQTES